MDCTLCFIGSLLIIIYYLTVVIETFSEKYYDSPIITKKDFYFALIPFLMWFKCFVKAFKDLE